MSLSSIFNRRLGSSLIATLFLVLFLFILGLGFLGRRAPLYDSAVYGVLEARALAIAQAGIEDARVKLNHDHDFPPPGDEEQEVFSYRETLLDVDGAAIGHFDVAVDTSRRAAPVSLIWVTSSGVAQQPGRPRVQARKVLRAEFEVSLLLRGSDFGDQIPNPNYLRLLNLEEVGSP